MDELAQHESGGQRLLKPAAGGPRAVPLRPVAASETVGVSPLLAVLWRHKLAIAATIVAGAVAGIGAGLFQTPVYRARTSLQIEGLNDNYFLRDVTPVSPVANSQPESYLDNQVKVLQSETLARRVADRLGLKDAAPAGPGRLRSVLGVVRVKLGLGTEPVRRAADSDERRIQRVQKAMNVRTSLRSQVLEVSFDAPDPEIAANGANAATQEFVAMNREARSQLVDDTTAWLSQQTADLKKRLETSGQELQDYARNAGLVFAGGQSTLSEEGVRQVQDSLAKAQAERAAKQARYEAVMSNSGKAAPEVFDSGPLREYQVTLGNMRRQLAEYKTLYTPAHTKVQRLEAQIAETEAAIAREREDIVSRIRTDYAAAVGQEKLLASAYAKQMKTVQDQNEKTTHYNLLKREYDTTQTLYESMLQKVKEAGMASALRLVNVRVIDPARPTSLPYSPNYPLNAAIGLVLGAIAGVGLVVVREQSDTMRRPGESSLVDVPELGVIPSARDDRSLNAGKGRLLSTGKDQEPLELVTWHQETSLMSESYRTVLASILLSAEARHRVLLVTSTDAGEGKTTTVTNLGIALRETQKRVLLIDADLRGPRLHDVFGLCNDRGFADLLQRPDAIDTADIGSLAIQTRIPDLWVLPSGPGTAAISSLLYSPALTKLLDRFRREFDLVLIDTPPAALYSDARVLGRVTDGVVIVVRAGKTTREQLVGTYRRFLEDETPVLGTILNDWRVNGSRQYGAYNSYYSKRRPRQPEAD